MRSIESYLRFICYRTEGIVLRDSPDSEAPVFDDKIPLMERATIVGRAARLYEIDSALVEGVFRAIDSASMLSYDDADPDRWANDWRAAANASPFPALQFPVMWIGFSRPFQAGMMHKIEQTARLTKWGRGVGQFEPHFRLDPHDLDSKITGMLLAETDDDRGIAVWVHEENLKEHRMASIVPVASPEDGWIFPPGGRWLPTVILAALMNRATFVEHPVSAATRRAWGRSGAHGKLQAQPWHEAKISTDTAAEIIKSILGKVATHFRDAEKAGS